MVPAFNFKKIFLILFLFLDYCLISYDVGNGIEVNGRTFTISGIYEEFGAPWIGSNSFRLFSEVDGMF